MCVEMTERELRAKLALYESSEVCVCMCGDDREGAEGQAGAL